MKYFSVSAPASKVDRVSVHERLHCHHKSYLLIVFEICCRHHGVCPVAQLVESILFEVLWEQAAKLDSALAVKFLKFLFEARPVRLCPYIDCYARLFILSNDLLWCAVSFDMSCCPR